MNRQDISFDAEGTTLRGWLYHPPTKIQRPPVVVMTHGFAAVKEQYLERFAERFTDAGLAVLLYDHRNFGASDGTPRNDIDPWQQIRDYQHAISFVRQRDDVDGDRVGIWGTSFSGGHVLVVGAIDPRVICVVSQIPTISGYASYQRRISPDRIQQMNEMLIADRERVFAGAAPEARNVIPNEDGQPGVYTSPAAVSFLSKPASRPETWDNMVTIRSMERARDYEPAIYVERISPKPLLMVVADQDTVTLTDLALQTYNNALEPKKLVLIPGEHWAPYIDQFEQASITAREWFVEHLMT